MTTEEKPHKMSSMAYGAVVEGTVIERGSKNAMVSLVKKELKNGKRAVVVQGGGQVGTAWSGFEAALEGNKRAAAFLRSMGRRRV